MGVSPREADRKNLRRKESGQQETHGRKPSGGMESLKGRKAALGGTDNVPRDKNPRLKTDRRRGLDASRLLRRSSHYSTHAVKVVTFPRPGRG